ncbi:dihydrolipoamide dehydrogenase [Mycoplasmoides fastidiosum]|uniref:Dihydrolipoyl dehydrogenase n=1 Tax=Mycoplasmoides fastidiosum TaxID=92758 RepID=A0ABU0LZC4_9BACT|nr:NAD(P)/FAD-dependent oxidoreductase [Mycoplasmoides fastidiosum]MDQ0514038.1 dihydrolipoamide dehydrogenase [Mycoplasmoides fastidiosum]UUD37553.1 NAD(P)/FAD-dependent oxidoreductase [Mycoplasmoides fastidiosum]
MNKPTKSYDVVVIGAGPGGHVAGRLSGSYGYKTLVLDAHNYGGTCLGRGCSPSKTLIASAKVYEAAKHAENQAIDVCCTSFDWDKIQARRQAKRVLLEPHVIDLINQGKAETYIGYAEAIDEHHLKVNDEIIEFKHLVLSTGAKPRQLNLPGFAEGYARGNIISSDEVLELKEVPKTMVIIGGGIVSMEMAFVYAAFGTVITILDASPRILPQYDPEVSDYMVRYLSMKNQMIIKTGVKIIDASEYGVQYEDSDGNRHFAGGEKVLVGIGREANFYGFEKLNLKRRPNGQLEINERYQTSLPHVYASGDVVNTVQNSYVAYETSRIIVDNIRGEPTQTLTNLIPVACFGKPEIAAIGLNEEQLKQQNKKYVALRVDTDLLLRTITDEQLPGFIKMQVDPDTNQILGVTIVAENANELIALATLAMHTNQTVFALAEILYAHPTTCEVYGTVAKKLIAKYNLQK